MSLCRYFGKNKAYIGDYTVFKKLMISETFPINPAKFWIPSLSNEYQTADNVWEPNIMQEGDKPTKVDSHIVCHPHAATMPFPRHAVR